MTQAEVVALLVVAAAVGGFVGYRLAHRASTVEAVTAPPRTTQPQGEPDRRFEQLVQSITVGIVILDRRGYITSLNAAAGAMFEIGSRPAIGRAIIELIPSFDLDRRVRDALAGHPSRGTITLSGGEGDRRLTIATLPIDGDDGVIVIAADETRVHALEQTRRDFVSNVSHELRTPLSSMKLMIETLVDRSEDAEARALFLPLVEEELERMVRLVEDLLEVARAESGRLRLRRSSVDLYAVTSATVRTFAQRGSGAGVNVRLSGEPSIVDGDEHRLGQVVANLLDNALRHTPSGGNVDVSVTSRGGQVYLRVHDTGEGIPYRDLPHVFERFYVVDRSRAREIAGTGLGLAIVKQIVEAHGGVASAESELGAGSTFTCTFPQAQSAVAIGASDTSQAS